MGQDGKDRKSSDADLTITRPAEPSRAFQHEIRAALRYERGLVVKALFALVVVAVIVTLRTLYFA